MQRNSRRSFRRQCSFCQRPTPEAKLILYATLLRLRKMLQQKLFRDPKTRNLEQKEESRELMGRLLITLFENNQFQMKISQNCKHSKIKNWFIDKLKCSSQQVQIVLDALCNRVARRNYQLQTISSQIKNVQNSVFQMGDSLIQQKKQLKNSRQKPSLIKPPFKEERRALNLESAQIQQQKPQIPNFNIGAPEIALSYNMPHNVLPPYNWPQNGLSFPQNQIPYSWPQGGTSQNLPQNQLPYSYNFFYYRPQHQ